MLADYDDIRSLIPEPPKWFDQNGVPRYNDFTPKDSPNIYADEVVLMEVACQNCDERFHGEMNSDLIHSFRRPTLADQVQSRQIHYGDPPRHDCTGDTMNSIPVRVLQFWLKTKVDGWPEWKRVPELEIDVTPDWATEEQCEP